MTTINLLCVHECSCHTYKFFHISICEFVFIYNVIQLFEGKIYILVFFRFLFINEELKSHQDISQVSVRLGEYL